MSFTTPRTWVTAEIVEATVMNTHIRDNLRYLKGIDGTLTIQDSITLQGSLEQTGTASYIRVAILTTTQRNALSGTNGMFVYNSTTTKFEKYENGAWRADWAYGGTFSDMQLPSQTRGDVIFCGTAGTAWERLPAGTSGQLLKTQGTANNPVWQTGIGVDNLAAAKLPVATGWGIAPGSLANLTDELFTTFTSTATGTAVTVETANANQVQIDLGAVYPIIGVFCKFGIGDAGANDNRISVRAGTAGDLSDISIGTGFTGVGSAFEEVIRVEKGTLLATRYITTRGWSAAGSAQFKGYEVLVYGKGVAVS